MDRNLALEFVRVTEVAAIAAAKWVGKGDANAADKAAVDEMRSRFNDVAFRGTVVIGEGEKDQAAELYIGEELGTGEGPVLDIAVDPLECTTSVANGTVNAISVIATGAKGSLFHAPDVHMDKIACGPLVKGAVDLDAPVADNIANAAKRLGKSVEDIVVMILERERHMPLINDIRATGARVRTITDGDVAGAIATCIPNSGIDLLMGIGASAEGVLAGAAIKCLGGDFQGRISPTSEKQCARLEKYGVLGIEKKKLTLEDLVAGEDITFTATGIVDGPLLKGVRVEHGYCVTHSVVMRVKTGTVRFIETQHKM